MKKLIKYFFIILVIFAILKNCTSPKKEKKQIEEVVTNFSSIEINLKLDYSKEQQLYADNLFGLNTGFIWTKEIDKSKDFVELLKESGNVVLRFPGGGVANNYYPDEVGYGYNPKKRPVGFKSIMLYNQTKDRKYNIIENFVSLCKQTNAKVIYCVNVLDGNVEKMQIVIDRLKKENIELIGVELGNELNMGNYRHVFPNGQVYLDTIQKYIQAIRKNYPDLKIGLVAETLDVNNLKDKRSQFMHEWNKKFSTTDFDAYIVHSYFPIDDKQKNFDEIFLKSVDISNPYYTNYTTNLLEYFNTIDKEQKKKIWITEWGIFNLYGGNTFLQAASTGQFLNNVIQFDSLNRIDIACLHDIGAMIGQSNPKLQYTYKNEKYAVGAIYFPYKFLSDIIVKNKSKIVAHQIDKKVPSNFVIQTFYSTENKKTYIYFINSAPTTVHLAIPTSKLEKQIEFIVADKLYAHTGFAAFLKDYPSKNSLIQYKKENSVTNQIKIAPYSLGVISF
ncbi:MAG: hypothetical protein R2760_09110 [Chitinophagales bacterium]